MRNFIFLLMLFCLPGAASDLTDVQWDILDRACKEGRADPTSPTVITRCAVISHEEHIKTLELINEPFDIEAINIRLHAIEAELLTEETIEAAEVMYPHMFKGGFDWITNEYLGPVMRMYFDSKAALLKYKVLDAYLPLRINVQDENKGSLFFGPVFPDPMCSDYSLATTYHDEFESQYEDAEWIAIRKPGSNVFLKLDKSSPTSLPVAYRTYGSNPACYVLDDEDEYLFYPVIGEYDSSLSGVVTFKYISEEP